MSIIETNGLTATTSPILSAMTKIFLEVKSVLQLNDQQKAQVRNYIGIAEKRLGLVYNFNDKYMTPVRILNLNLRDCYGN